MAVVLDTDNEEVRLEGNDAAAMEAWIEIPAPPATAFKMQWAYRAYYDTYASDYNQTGKGWNQTNCLGLRFSNAVPKFPSDASLSNLYVPTDFFGWCQQYPASGQHDRCTFDVLGPHANTDNLTVVQPASVSNIAFIGFFDATSAVEDEANTGNDVLGNVSERTHWLPANPTDGALFTGLWEVWGSSVNKSVFARRGFNSGGLSGSAMFGALDDADAFAVHSWTIHGDVTSNWRVSQELMAWPLFFVCRYAGATQKLVLKDVRVRFLDLAENVLQETDLTG